jgi:diacylglycerol kinase (ATP)
MRIYFAMLNSCRGFSHAARTEAALRQELILLAVAIGAGVYLAPNAGWYVAMIGVLLVILAIELLNTAIEKLADHINPDWHPSIGLIKDFGSAAVFCGLALAALIWTAAVSERFHLFYEF